VTVEELERSDRYRALGADLILAPFEDAADVSVNRLLDMLRARSTSAVN